MSAESVHVGRYWLRQSIGSGGMASVHLARMRGPLGFSRTVAVKRLHRQMVEDPAFASMLVEEARLASRIRHPNVVPTLDVIAEGGELLLVMEYVSGEPLSALLQAASRRKEPVPVAVGVAIASAMLQGLHAAHEAVDEEGQPLQLVHRDVSPQNVLVDTDGQTRIADFGIAKARGRLSVTLPGELRGKLGYVSPEQIDARPIDRRSDVYAAGVVIWELLTSRRLHHGDSEGEVLMKILMGTPVPPSTHNPQVGRAIDDVVLRALERAPEARFSSAAEMAEALEAAMAVASQREVAMWVRALAGERIAERAALVAAMEREAPGEPRETAGAADRAGASTPSAFAGPPSSPGSAPEGPPAFTPRVQGPTDDIVTVARARPGARGRGRWPWLVAAALALGGATWAYTGRRTDPPISTTAAAVEAAPAADPGALPHPPSPTVPPPALAASSAATTPSSPRAAPVAPRPRARPTSSAGHPLYTRH